MMNKFDKIVLKNRANKSIKQAIEREQVKIKESPSWEERIKMWVNDEFGSQEPSIVKSFYGLDDTHTIYRDSSTSLESIIPARQQNQKSITEIHEDIADQNREITMLRKKVDELEGIIKEQQTIIDRLGEKTDAKIIHLEEKLKKFDKYASALKWARNYIRKTCKSVTFS